MCLARIGIPLPSWQNHCPRGQKHDLMRGQSRDVSSAQYIWRRYKAGDLVLFSAPLGSECDTMFARERIAPAVVMRLHVYSTFVSVSLLDRWGVVFVCFGVGGAGGGSIAFPILKTCDR